MSRPTKLPRWASVPTVNGTTGKNNVVEPADAKKDLGWDYLEYPARNYQNWLDNTTYNWLLYLDTYVNSFDVQEQTTPNMTMKIGAGTIKVGNVPITVAAQNTGTISAPVGNPRIDRIVLDETGVVQVVTGTPAGSPTAPALSDNHFPLAQVLLQTSTTYITNNMITPERGSRVTALSRRGDTMYGNYALVSGNLGIGTSLSTIQALLHLQSTAPTLRFSDSDAGTDAAVTGSITWYRGNNTSKVAELGKTQGSTSDFYITNVTNANIEIRTSNILRATFTGGGNMALGAVNTASELLHLQSPDPFIRMSDTASATNATSYGGLEFYRGSTTSKLGHLGFTSGNGKFYLRNQTGEGGFIFEDWNGEYAQIANGGGMVLAQPIDALNNEGIGTLNIKNNFYKDNLPITFTEPAAFTLGAVFAANADDGADSTNIFITSVVAANSWELIGPTGSGSNIWTALDQLPTGVRFAVIKSRVIANSPDGSGNFSIDIRVRKSGTFGTGLHQAVHRIVMDSALIASFEDWSMWVVPLNSNRGFDVWWSSVGSWSIYFYLVGHI